MAKITLSIFGRERTKENGEKFCKYSFTPDGVDFYEIVFKKECMTTPKQAGYWKMTVNEEDVDFKDGKVVEGKKYKAKRIEKRNNVFAKLTGVVNE